MEKVFQVPIRGRKGTLDAAGQKTAEFQVPIRGRKNEKTNTPEYRDLVSGSH